jgi:CheY-like chemotaxis protein
MSQTVLVVDDMRMNRVMLTAILRGVGYTTLEAEDGEVALRMIREHRPAIVLLDIMMPNLDGIACCRAIKEDPVLCATKVVMVTSRGEADQVKKAFTAGCDGYLIKPVDQEELKSKVAQFVRLSDAHHHLRGVLRRP